MRRSRLAPLAHVVLGLTLAGTVSACAPAARAPEFLPPSRPAQFSLAGIPWGIRGDSVTALVEPRGYNFNRADADGDLLYDGVLMRTPTRVLAFLTPEQKLVKFRVVMLTPDEDALSTYQAARAELTRLYGAPSETIEAYAPPYTKQSPKTLEAIRRGKGTLRTHWLVGEGTRRSHVAVGVTERLVVTVDYEGPAWDREQLRRARGGTRGPQATAAR